MDDAEAAGAPAKVEDYLALLNGEQTDSVRIVLHQQRGTIKLIGERLGFDVDPYFKANNDRGACEELRRRLESGGSGLSV